MKKLEFTRQQFKILVVVLFSMAAILLAFGLPEVLPLFGVKKVFADLSSVAVCGMCYAVIKRWPSFVEYGLPALIISGLRRCGVSVIYVENEDAGH